MVEEKLEDIKKKCLAFQEFLGCEGHLAVTPVTPLIAKVDSAALAGEAGVPLLMTDHVHPGAALSVGPLVREDSLSSRRDD